MDATWCIDFHAILYVEYDLIGTDEIVTLPSFPSAAPETPERNVNYSNLVALPPTVTVRRRQTDRSRRSSRRRSGCIQEKVLISELDLVPASPISRDPQLAERMSEEDHEVRHSTPEATPPRKPQQRGRKPANKQSRGKPEPPAKKQERGRRPDVGPLKRPWENSKPRARSKSRDRSATRAKATPAAPSHKANTSLGFNDNFDFDCEESVHVTPFRSKAEENPVARACVQQGGGANEPEPMPESPVSSLSSQSEDSPYVPRKWQRRSSAEQTNMIATRQGRAPRVVRGKENISSKSPVSRPHSRSAKM